MTKSEADEWRTVYPSPTRDNRKKERERRKARRSRWHVQYDLVYDGGYSIWMGYYRTYFGARVAIFWNVHMASWGGTASIKEQRNG